MQSFYSRFVQSAERWPQNIAVEIQRHDSVESHTYTELRQMAESIGQWLQQIGLQRGARCAILAANSPRWVAAHLGTLAAGYTVVPLDVAFRADQVEKLLNDCGASLVFTDEKHLRTSQQATRSRSVEIVLLDATPEHRQNTPNLDALFASGADHFVPADVNGSDLACLFYTSGTTSDPKGVMLTHDNLLAEMEGVFAVIKVYPSDAILGVLPLFHVLAQMANLLLPFAAGARVVYLESMNTSELMRALRERDITLFCVVPQFFYLIHDKVMKQVASRGAAARGVFKVLLETSRVARKLGINLGKIAFRQVHETLGPKMRLLITGGSRFDPAIGSDFEAMGFTILQGYGLTETTGAAFVTRPKDNVMGSVGQALPGVEGKLVSAQPQEEGGPEIGQVAIRGRIVMKGYWNRPDATAQAVRDGWLHTGDLGYFDSSGSLFITGREKEVIVLSSGKNVYPEEIEAHYEKSPYIKEICVLGLESAPGEPFSERLHGVIVPDFDVMREKKIVNMGEIIRWDVEGLSAELPSTKRILSYEIWQHELPRTTTRKLKRFEILKQVQQQQASQQPGVEQPVERQLTEEDQLWLAEPDVERALTVIREVAKREPDKIHPSANLELDLGLDSMERVELLVALEQAFGARVDESAASQIYTVRELIEAIRAGKGAGARTQFPGWDAVLREEPTEPEVLAISQPHKFATPAWFMVARLINLIARDLFQLRVTGLEKLPRDGPYIISPNHQSYLDPIVLASQFPYSVFRRSFSVGTSAIFGKGLMRWLGHALRTVPVDPDANLVPAMRAGAFGLRRGGIMVLFPEGERSIDGSPKTFKKGAAILAHHLNVPVYPVALEGFFDVWPRGKNLQGFYPLQMAIGDPVMPRPGETAEAAYDRLTKELRSRVMEMWNDLRREKERQRDKGHALAAAAD
jgi:long-chain acyl-CoA synthetase